MADNKDSYNLFSSHAVPGMVAYNGCTPLELLQFVEIEWREGKIYFRPSMKLLNPGSYHSEDFTNDARRLKSNLMIEVTKTQLHSADPASCNPGTTTVNYSKSLQRPPVQGFGIILREHKLGWFKKLLSSDLNQDELLPMRGYGIVVGRAKLGNFKEMKVQIAGSFDVEETSEIVGKQSHDLLDSFLKAHFGEIFDCIGFEANLHRGYHKKDFVETKKAVFACVTKCKSGQKTIGDKVSKSSFTGYKGAFIDVGFNKNIEDSSTFKSGGCIGICFKLLVVEVTYVRDTMTLKIWLPQDPVTNYAEPRLREAVRWKFSSGKKHPKGFGDPILLELASPWCPAPSFSLNH